MLDTPFSHEPSQDQAPVKSQYELYNVSEGNSQHHEWQHRRRNKREKKLVNKNAIQTSHPNINSCNDKLGIAFNHHIHRQAKIMHQRKFLMKLSFACFFSFFMVNMIQSGFLSHPIVALVNALDQDEISLLQKALDHFDKEDNGDDNDDDDDDDDISDANIQSVLSKLFAGSDLKAYLKDIDNLFTDQLYSNSADSSKGTSPPESTASTSSASMSMKPQQNIHFPSQSHHISSKRRDLFNLAMAHPVIDIGKDNEYSTKWTTANEDYDLEEVCALFPNKNHVGAIYWRYEWCHKKRIIQFHADSLPVVKNDLGKFEGEDRSGVNFYVGGDHCGGEDPATSMKQRFSRVVFECCSSHFDKLNSVDKEDFISFVEKDHDISKAIYIRSVEETDVCEYTVRICRPLSCLTHHKDSKNATRRDNHQLSQPRQPLFPKMSNERIQQNKKLILKMFTHAYDSYMYNAFPNSELRPLSCKGGKFPLIRIKCLTLIDTLDTFIIFGNYTEFARGVERLRVEDLVTTRRGKVVKKGGLFDADQNVSVFETNIRVLGGLLSAHQLALAALSENQNVRIPLDHIKDADGNVLIGAVPNKTDFSEETKLWEYDGFLLELAEDMGKRLLPAFNTKSGIPYGTINLRSGVPRGETTQASLAGGGTLTLEMELLSRLTGNPTFGKVAKLATRALWVRRSPLTSLLGKHVDVNTGKWKETLSGIGSNSDSFYEYLLKHYILYNDEDFWHMFVETYRGVIRHLKTGDFYSDVDMTFPQSKKQVMESLQGFWPGVQVLLGELVPAARTLNSYFLVREELGFLPERFHFEEWKVDTGGRGGAGKHPLRPELFESAYFMHRSLYSSSPSSGWQWAMEFSLKTLQRLTWTKCGYAAVKTVRRGGRKRELELEDDMPSFFLSETLKYLYLIFDDDNFLHRDDGREWVFTTEAHPIHFVPPIYTNKEEEDKMPLSTKSEKVEKENPLTQWQQQGPQKWTVSTTEKDFLGQIAQAEKQQYHNPNPSLMNLFYGPATLPERIKSQEVHTMDLPELHFYPKGCDWAISKSCTNYFHSSLDWMHALNGNAGLEYEETYDSMLNNDYEKEQMLSPYRPHHKKVSGDDMCELIEGHTAAPQSRSNVNENLQDSPNDNLIGTNRFDMGDMGLFDVTVVEHGFFVKQLDSNESVEFTTVQLGTFSAAASFIIRVSTGIEDRMVITDTKNNSYKCEFVVRYPQGLEAPAGKSKLATLPCSPAMFGPTKLSKLIKNKGLIIEGEIHLPHVSDEVGCNPQSNPIPSDDHEDGRIQLIMRGVCPFQEKALNQKINYNADGVVVINTQPDHLFVLDKSDSMGQIAVEEAATILITREHGLQLIKNIKNHQKLSEDGNHFRASIELTPPSLSKLKSDDERIIDWPHIDSNSNEIQILSKSNWGVHAKRNVKSGQGSWQLYILKHNYVMGVDSVNVNP